MTTQTGSNRRGAKGALLAAVALAALMAATTPAVGWVQTRDLGTSDGLHFDSAGVVTLGERLAAEWLQLAGGCD